MGISIGIAVELAQGLVGASTGIIHLSKAGTSRTKKLQRFSAQILQFRVP